MNLRVKQFKAPHCGHCTWCKEHNDTCIKALMSQGLNRRARACGSRKCVSFEPREEYKQFYAAFLNSKNGEKV